MKIDLMDFMEEEASSLGLSGELELENARFNGRDLSFVEPIVYEGEIYKVDREFYIHLNIDYSYQESCGRCLNNFTEKNHTKLTAKLTDSMEEIEENEETNFVYYDDISNIDLSKDIRDMILLSLPMTPICSESCKGLCQVCGIDLNKEDCDCEVDRVDPRLAILKDFVPEE